MSNRVKIFGLIGVIFLATSTLTYLATVTLIQSSYTKLETSDTQKNTARVVDALTNKIDQLAIKASDWSSWDDTHDFIKDRNPEFIKSNLTSSALQRLAINFMLFYDTSGRLVYAKGVDTSTGEDIAVPGNLSRLFMPGSRFLAKTPGSNQSGLIGTSSNPIALVSQPILTSENGGPVNGTLVFAQYLAAGQISELAELTHLPLSYHQLNGAALPPDVSAVRSRLSEVTSTVQVLNNQTVAGYQLMNDINGQPLLVAGVKLPRDLYAGANQTLAIYLVIIGLVTLSSMLILIYTTNLISKRDQTIQLKNEFFSIASHELRTPLAAIRGNSALIKSHYGSKNDAALGELADDIHDSSLRLTRIVNNFLDAARLERGQLPLTPRVVKIAPIVEAVVGELQAVAQEKQLYIRTNLPAKLPGVYADPERLQQVIYNLLGNAMKFTDNGGITIAARAEGKQVKILITDTGRGISPAGQRVLFKRFQQTEAADAATGSGLGLYISKMLVEHMGGRIQLEKSAEGHGTTLSFTLDIKT